MWKEFNTARKLDNLSKESGLPSIEEMRANDPTYQLIEEGNRIMRDLAADSRFHGQELERSSAISRERFAPGYLARKNKERSDRGLPPIVPTPEEQQEINKSHAEREIRQMDTRRFIDRVRQESDPSYLDEANKIRGKYGVPQTKMESGEKNTNKPTDQDPLNLFKS